LIYGSRRNFKTYTFDGFKPTRTLIVITLTEEVSWHTDTARNLIGAVFFEKTDADWGFVILGRDPKGNFRGIKIGASIASQREAKANLLSEMAGIEASGQFPIT